MRTGAYFTFAIFISQTLLSLTVSAAKWDTQSSLSVRSGYSDNTSLRSSNKIASTEGQLSSSTKFSLSTPRSGVSGDASFNIRRYIQANTPDRNNVRVGINSFYNMEKSTVGLNGNFVRDSTLDSQLDETSTGFVDLNRISRGAGAFWSYNFDPRTNASINYNYQYVDYEDAVGSGFANFNRHSSNLSISHRINQRLSLTASGSYSLNENDNNITTESSSIQAGGFSQFSETLSASISLGRSRTIVDFKRNSLVPIVVANNPAVFILIAEDITNEGKGTTYDIKITKTFERGNTALSATKRISTSVSGTPIEVTHLDWVTLYGLTTTVSGNFAVRGRHSEIQDVLGNTSNTESIIIGPSINWDFSKAIRISMHYTLSRYKFDNETDDAVANAAYLTLRYQ